MADSIRDDERELRLAQNRSALGSHCQQLPLWRFVWTPQAPALGGARAERWARHGSRG